MFYQYVYFHTLSLLCVHSLRIRLVPNCGGNYNFIPMSSSKTSVNLKCLSHPSFRSTKSFHYQRFLHLALSLNKQGAVSVLHLL